MTANLPSPHPTASAGPGVPTRLGGRKRFYIAFRCGQMGNRIALFANFVAFVEEHGHRLMNFTFHSYADLFESTHRDIFCQYPAPQRNGWLDRLPGVAGAIRQTRIFYHVIRAACRLHERTGLFGRRAMTLRESPGSDTTPLEAPELQGRIREADVVFVYGWNFRAPTYMQRHAEKIRAYFRPMKAHERASRQAVEPLRQQAEVVVGVHLRHGDYRRWRGGKYFFPASRYAAWMQTLAEQFPGRRVAYLVCSDEPRDRAEFPGLAVGFGPGCPVEDLYALSNCDYVFGPPSSFSQWASFYGNVPLFHVSDTGARIELGEFRVSYLAEIPR